MSASAQFPDEQSADGHFERQEDAFLDWVRADGSTDLAPAAGRYHLYVSYACPWAHRIILARLVESESRRFAAGIAIPTHRVHRQGDGAEQNEYNAGRTMSPQGDIADLMMAMSPKAL